MATMQDVATLAHVSLSTVSYAINNTRPISAATRERIIAASGVGGVGSSKRTAVTVGAWAKRGSGSTSWSWWRRCDRGGGRRLGEDLVPGRGSQPYLGPRSLLAPVT